MSCSQILPKICLLYLADFRSHVVSEVEWASPRSLGSSCLSNNLLARARRDKAEPSQSLLRPDLRLSREGGVERDGGVVGDEAVVESEGGVGEWWRGGDDL